MSRDKEPYSSVQDTKACSPGSERISGTRRAVRKSRRCVCSCAANTSMMRRSEKEFIVCPSAGTGGINANGLAAVDAGRLVCSMAFAAWVFVVTAWPLLPSLPCGGSSTTCPVSAGPPLHWLVLPSLPHLSAPPPWPPRLGALAREPLAGPAPTVATAAVLAEAKPAPATPALLFCLLAVVAASVSMATASSMATVACTADAASRFVSGVVPGAVSLADLEGPLPLGSATFKASTAVALVTPASGSTMLSAAASAITSGGGAVALAPSSLAAPAEPSLLPRPTDAPGPLVLAFMATAPSLAAKASLRASVGTH
mmetsp:Transcript_113433/g.352339  ORF Transcript_113433/g.352339 Transcript_113433/m.352339 type:complete len:313 (+) Transcript_113433:1146-2084(+)